MTSSCKVYNDDYILEEYLHRYARYGNIDPRIPYTDASSGARRGIGMQRDDTMQNTDLRTLKNITAGRQIMLIPKQAYEIKNKGEQNEMETKPQTKTGTTKKEVEYLKAGWINKSKSGLALTFKIEERFYSVPISSIKDLLSSDKSGVTFSEVKEKA